MMKTTGKKPRSEILLLYWVWIILLIAMVFLVFAPWIPPPVKDKLASPGLIISLLGLFLTSWRDGILQEKEQRVSLAVRSELSAMVFQEQINFAKKYNSCLQTELDSMYQKGEEDIEKSAKNLWLIRREFIVFLPRKVNQILDAFEKSLLKISRDAELAKQMAWDKDSKAVRKKLWKDIYRDLYCILRGWKTCPPSLFEDGETPLSSQQEILYALSDLLSINELTDLRSEVVGQIHRGSNGEKGSVEEKRS